MLALRLRTCIVVGASAVVECTSRPYDLLPISRPYAVITDTVAVFAFPFDTVAAYTWDEPDSTHYLGRPEFYWQVGWQVSVDRHGLDPQGLLLVAEWRTGGPHHGNLQLLLAGREVDIVTWCSPCSTPAVTTVPDSAVTFTVDGRQLAFVVHGAAAIRRIFRARPEAVTFERGARDGSSAEWQVTVSTPRP